MKSGSPCACAPVAATSTIRVCASSAGYLALDCWASAHPRRDQRRRSRLISEHQSRIGDPARGGMSKLPIMTAYRQQALACAASLSKGPRRTSEIKMIVPQGPKILLHNVYGWFSRVERGVYRLTDAGTSALARWSQPPFDPSRAWAGTNHLLT
jgi:hypothetical protein